MTAAWPQVSFNDAPLQIIDGDRGKNYPKQDEFENSGYCLFLNTGNVSKSGFKFGDCQFVTEQKDNLLRKGKLTREDVIMTTRGTIGNVGYFNRHVPFEHIRINSGMVVFRADREKLLPSFLYQYLRSDQFNKQVNSLRSGAAQPQLPIRDIKVIELPLPPLRTQKAISETVSKYDDLIENNKRRIELLEESARQLYKEWFVRFRFPGHEHVKIIDGVPEGWKLGSVGDIAKIFSGFAFKSKDWLEEGNPVIKIKNITSNNTVDVSDCQCVDDNVAEKAARFRLAAGDMLIAMTGATVGKVGLMPSSEQSFYLNQRVGKFESKLGRDVTPLLLSFFNSEKAQSSILNLAGGAAQPNISAKQIESIELPIPTEAILNFFLDETDSQFSLRLNLIDQNFRLTQARDLLLPKLMNGEVTV